jgi:hypothetical protein
VARAIVTSLVREAGLDEPSGFVRIVDLDHGTVRTTFAMPESRHRARDPNPRGGLRGAKGIGVYGDRVVLANAERLFVLDTSWRLVAEVTHPWLAGVHDLLCEADGIWVACANADMVLRFSWEGALLEEWTWRREPDLAAAFGFVPPPPFRPQLDYRDPAVAHTGVHAIAHVNGVARGTDGLLVSLGRILSPALVRALRVRAAAARLTARAGIGSAAIRTARRRRARRLAADRRVPVERLAGSSFALVALGEAPRVLLRVDRVAVPNHNVHEEDGLLVYNDSNRGCLVGVDRETAQERHEVTVPGDPAFARGLASLGGGRFLVGSQAPLAIHTIDLLTGRVVASLPLGGKRRECVYAIALLPDRFADPPTPFDWVHG